MSDIENPDQITPEDAEPSMVVYYVDVEVANTLRRRLGRILGKALVEKVIESAEFGDVNPLGSLGKYQHFVVITPDPDLMEVEMGGKQKVSIGTTPLFDSWAQSAMLMEVLETLTEVMDPHGGIM